MTPLEKIQSMKMPFAELKGVTFIAADSDRVVAQMVVRPELCTLRNTIHGGAVMAFADSVGADPGARKNYSCRQGDGSFARFWLDQERPTVARSF